MTNGNNHPSEPPPWLQGPPPPPPQGAPEQRRPEPTEGEPVVPPRTPPFQREPERHHGEPPDPGPPGEGPPFPPPPAPQQFGEPPRHGFPGAPPPVVPNGPGPNRHEHPEQLQSGGPVYSWAPPQTQQPAQAPPPGQPPQQGPRPPQSMPQPAEHGAPPPQHPGPPPPQRDPWQSEHRIPSSAAEGYGQSTHSPYGDEKVNDLNLLRRTKRQPRSGWRRAVHRVSGGAINPGESRADIAHRELVERVNQPVRGDYRIAILSLKGGVGKTTTTVGMGSTFASVRGDRVIAIDANPDLGTLAHRVPRQTPSTVRNLLEDQHIQRYSDVRAHTSQAPSRLEILASEQDPAVSEAFSEADYRRAISILQQFYNIILTDCGTGLMHSAMSGVLDMASSLVLVTSPAIDGARSASATLDWLEHHGYGKLVERTVVVVNSSRRGASTVDLEQLRRLFLDRTRAVQVVPFDDHLAEGAEIDLELVSKQTRQSLLELAAMVADDFNYLPGATTARN